MSARVVTVNEILGGHVVLDIECLDRIYLNAYVPILQSSGQVVAFMTQYLDMPIPSPALPGWRRLGVADCGSDLVVSMAGDRSTAFNVG